MGPTSFVKLIILFLFWLLVTGAIPEGSGYRMGSTVMATLVAGMAMLLVRRFRRFLLSNRGLAVLGAIPVFVGLFLFQLSQEPKTGRLPAGMTFRDPREAPDYRTSWVARVRVLERVSSRNTIAEVLPLTRMVRQTKVLRYPVYGYPKTRHSNSNDQEQTAQRKDGAVTSGKNVDQKSESLFRSRYRRFYQREKKYEQTQSVVKDNEASSLEHPKANRRSYRQIVGYRTYQKSVWKVEQEYDSSQSFRALLRVNIPQLYPGCELKVRIYGRAVPVSPSPGYARYLERKRVAASLKLSRKYHVESHQCPQAMPVREAVRGKILEIIQNSRMSEDAIGATRGMVLGDATFMTYRFRDSSSRMGILHLFAASGLHLAILFGAFYIPFAWFFGRRHPVAVMLPLLPVGLYVWMLNFPVSLSRAFMFGLFFAMKSVVHRRISITDRVLNAAILTALVLPRDSFSVSGYLSFAAVTGILYFYRSIESVFPAWKSKFYRAMRSQMSLSVSATLFTGPLILGYFSLHPFGGLLANVVLVPLVGLVLPLVYGALLLIFVSSFALGAMGYSTSVIGMVSEIIWYPAASGMELFVLIVDTISPYSMAFRFPHPFSAVLIAQIGLILMVVVRELLQKVTLRRTTRLSRFRKSLRVAILLSIFLIGPLGGVLSYWTWSVPGWDGFFTGKPLPGDGWLEPEFYNKE